MTTKRLTYGDLTDKEKAVVDNKLENHGEGFDLYRISGELFFADEFSTWSVVIPNKHEETYPDAFADQDEGSTEDATIITSRLIALTVDLADDDDAMLKLVAKDYLGVDYKHIDDITVAHW